MAKLLVMPKLGLTMNEGKISRWLKKEGDLVEQGQPLFEVETDKLTNSIDAPETGILKRIIVKEGNSTKVTEPIGIIGAEGEDISDLLKNYVDNSVEEKQNNKEDKIEAREKVILKDNYIKAYPYAKKLANDEEIELSEIIPNREDGILRSIDIEKYKESKKGEKIKVSPVAKKMAEDEGINLSEIDLNRRIMKEDILNRIKDESYISTMDEFPIERVRITGMRKVISERMHESWMTSPRVNYTMEINMENIIKLRNTLKGEFQEDDLKISYNHIMMMIISKSLMDYPYLNASIDRDEIILHKYVNIGLAVDVGDGLLVPNLKNVEKMSLRDISVLTEDLINSAKNNNLSPDDLSNGTFTITNLGMFGIDSFTPIINQPEVAILGLNRIIEKPIVENGAIAIKPMMNLSLTADHRIVDGAVAAKFLSRVRELMENPYLLLV